MAVTIVEMLRRNYDETYGVVNLRPVLDELLRMSEHPFEEISASFPKAEPRWQLPILEAMRVLAASHGCSEDEAQEVLKATQIVALDIGKDEYFKSVNALVASPDAAGVLKELIARLLAQPSDHFARRLAFYIVGMLVEHRRAEFTKDVLSALRHAADTETSTQSRLQMEELLEGLPQVIKKRHEENSGAGA